MRLSSLPVPRVTQLTGETFPQRWSSLLEFQQKPLSSQMMCQVCPPQNSVPAGFAESSALGPSSAFPHCLVETSGFSLHFFNELSLISITEVFSIFLVLDRRIEG